MSKTSFQLNARTAQLITSTGLHADGDGLYLQVKNGGRSWVFIYSWDKRRREMGLGSFKSVSLATARESAREARSHLAAGRNPIEVRKAERQALRQAERVETFGAFAETYIDNVEAGWRNPKHRQQWRNSLREHAARLQDIPIAAVSTQDVVECLQPIWLTKPETANRVRGRDRTRNLRSEGFRVAAGGRGQPSAVARTLGCAPAKKVTLSRGHHAAMPYAELPVFMQELEKRSAMSARAMTFLILCAARTGEVLGARWEEITGSEWTVPAARMKTSRPHTVMLSRQALELLQSIKPKKADGFIFHSGRPSAPLSGMSLLMLLRRMGMNHVTSHGFRSAFKDWSANETTHADEVSEEALAHEIGSKVRKAYRRGAALQRRADLMRDWSSFLYPIQLKVELPSEITSP
ncbi:tyrosine-type recombinase/integrase [Sphingomonas sp. 22R3R2A-7]|uniref:tyrosine-type recombinase/integrase n=1 Tax=Sphingomonas sp. 22R3R2A-7 TaxID=3050230 RepID=UPI002FE38F84